MINYKCLFPISIILLSALTCGSCENKNKETVPEDQQVIDMTLRKPDGDPVGTHRDRDGILWDDDDILAPRVGESLNDERFQRTSTDSLTPDDAYDEGYNNGYEQGKIDSSNGHSHGYGYDDSSDYDDYYETKYQEGYDRGYDEGFNSGKLEYQRANEQY